MRIVTVKPTDDEGFRVWHAVNAAGFEAGRVDPTTTPYPEALVAYQHPSVRERREVFLVCDGDTAVGSGSLELPLRENRRLAGFHIAVPPEHRDRGIGAALYEYIEERAKAEGRTSLLTDVFLPGIAEPEDSPGSASSAGEGSRCATP